MNQLETLDKQLDIANKALSLAFKAGLMIGGAVLLGYCWMIDYFPRDMSIGDGFFFLMLAIAFGGVYLLFTASLTCLGVTLRPIWYGIYCIWIWGIKTYNKICRSNKTYLEFNMVTGRIEHLVFALFGLLFVWGFASFDFKVIGSLILSIFGCALLWSGHQQSGDEILEIETKESSTAEDKKRIIFLKKHQKILVIVIMIIPLLLGGVSGKLLDGAMRLSNVKEDKVTVHIKKPYLEYVAEHKIKANKSNLGKEYGTFENMNVLFNGFGKNVVLTQSGIDNPINLVIPSDHIIIIQR